MDTGEFSLAVLLFMIMAKLLMGGLNLFCAVGCKKEKPFQVLLGGDQIPASTSSVLS